MEARRKIEFGAAEALAAKLQQRIPQVPPVDLELIAQHLGVSAISFAPLTEEGPTTWSDGRAEIELRPDRPSTRTRFTLAHEIAHVLLATDDTTLVRRRQFFDLDDEEKLCDWIAAALLMPRIWIVPFAEGDPYTLSMLRAISHRAEVSMSAAAVRLSEVGRRRCVLLRWRRTDRRWVLAGQAGVPATLTGYLETTPETSAVLDAAPKRRDTWMSLTLTVCRRRTYSRSRPR